MNKATDQELRIDPALRSYLPIPDPARVDELEDLIVRNGCEDPIIVRAGVIIDGHNRYSICRRRGLPFKTQEIPATYDSDCKVRIYMLERALFGQTRTIDTAGRRELMLKLYELHIENGSTPAKTVELIAQKYGVSKRTAYREVEAGKAVQSIPREVTDAAGGKDKLSKLSSKGVKRFAELTKDEQIDIVERNAGDAAAIDKELSKRRPKRDGTTKPVIGESDQKATQATKEDRERAAKRPATQAIRSALEHLAAANKAMFEAKSEVKPSRFASWRQRMIDLDTDWSSFIEEQLEREGVQQRAPF